MVVVVEINVGEGFVRIACIIFFLVPVGLVLPACPPMMSVLSGRSSQKNQRLPSQWTTANLGPGEEARLELAVGEGRSPKEQ